MKTSRISGLVVACILIVYVFNVERWRPLSFFGQFQDDSIYFSTAKALAQGQGYRLVSFPGSPSQTKFPILYPYLLSWVWKVYPNFPDNLKPAMRLTELFGCWSLVAAFYLVRKFGIGERAALLLTALCAFQPIFLRFSGLLMSDVPFMALVLTTLILADSATRSGASLSTVLATGAVAGLSVGLRTVGVAVVMGIFSLALRRRAFREAFLMVGVAGAAIVIESWPMLFHRIAAAPSIGGEPGWNQTVAYYTDYLEFNWRMGIPSVWALLVLVQLNLRSLVSSPGSILVGLWNASRRITALLSVPVWIGFLRQARRPEGQPTGYVMIFYSCILVVFAYHADRYLLPFIPMFFVGLWLEIPRLGAMCWANLRGGAPLLQRVLAGALACIFTFLLGFMAWNYLVRDPRQWQLASDYEAHALEEKKQAYQWIRENTRPNDRIAASEDAVMYLYTGRQGLRPAFLPQDFYMGDLEILRRDLAHICDAPRHAGVRYWLTTNEDFIQEMDKAQIDARMAEVAAVLPVVFRSKENYVQIHDASCLTDLDRADCRAAAPILFPDSVSKAPAPSQVSP